MVLQKEINTPIETRPERSLPERLRHTPGHYTSHLNTALEVLILRFTEPRGHLIKCGVAPCHRQ